MLFTIRQLKGAISIAFTSFCLDTLPPNVIHAAVTVSVEPTLGDTGTLHFSKSIKLKMDDGAPLVIQTNVEKGVFAPNAILFSKKIAKDLAVVVGESSTGAGSDTLEVFLIAVVDDLTVVKDHMAINVPRGDGWLVWSENGYFLVVRPRRQLEEDDIFIEAKSFAVKYVDLEHLKFFSFEVEKERITANDCFDIHFPS